MLRLLASVLRFLWGSASPLIIQPLLTVPSDQVPASRKLAGGASPQVIAAAPSAGGGA